jgi:hypothetical protein
MPMANYHYADCYPVPQSEARGHHSFYRAHDGSLLVRHPGWRLVLADAVDLQVYAWLRKFAIITARDKAGLDIGEGIAASCYRDGDRPSHLRLIRGAA